MARVLPPGEFPIVDMPLDHPIMHTLYDVKDYLQVLVDPVLVSEQAVQRPNADHDSAQVHYRGIQDRTAG